MGTFRSVHRYVGTAFRALLGRRVVVATDEPEPAAKPAGSVGDEASRSLTVYEIASDGLVTEQAYEVAASDLEPCGEDWLGVLPYPRVVLLPPRTGADTDDDDTDARARGTT